MPIKQKALVDLRQGLEMKTRGSSGTAACYFKWEERPETCVAVSPLLLPFSRRCMETTDAGILASRLRARRMPPLRSGLQLRDSAGLSPASPIAALASVLRATPAFFDIRL